jgi:hypothetical protein
MIFNLLNASLIDLKKIINIQFNINIFFKKFIQKSYK